METLKWIFIRCWPLNESCAVDWDAWVAGLALASVAATLFLGFMTLRLGRAANRASSAAVGIAALEAKTRKERDRDERLILMMRLAGEMSDTMTRLQSIRGHVVADDGTPPFLTSQEVRDEVVATWKCIRFTNYEACSDRIHYLSLPVAARMARVVGIVGSFSADIDANGVPGASDAKAAVESFEFVTRVLLADLGVIQEECGRAVGDLQMADAAVVAEADKFSGN
ncbi:TPA: hypothetical protein UM046_004316 [Stenotrophomonas maltophilia]|nr:hypothetical protein [Stenotrophomonas maltophilia]HEL3786500.1 hypothetical protein [Stenotrophomonas maltophilia]